MTIETPKANWRTVDVSALTAPQRKAYDAFCAANKMAGEARKAFETLYIAGVAVPVGKMIKLSYRYGLGVAIVDADGARTGGKAKVTSLADYIASQA